MSGDLSDYDRETLSMVLSDAGDPGAREQLYTRVRAVMVARNNAERRVESVESALDLMASDTPGRESILAPEHHECERAVKMLAVVQVRAALAFAAAPQPPVPDLMANLRASLDDARQKRKQAQAERDASVMDKLAAVDAVVAAARQVSPSPSMVCYVADVERALGREAPRPHKTGGTAPVAMTNRECGARRGNYRCSLPIDGHEWHVARNRSLATTWPASGPSS